MNLLADSAAFALLALAGSAHCAGMCGGFAILVAARGKSAPRSCGHLGAYGLGKTASYLVVGFTASLGSQALTRAHLHELRLGLAWLVGAGLIAAGLRGLIARGTAARRQAAPPRFLAGLYRAVRELPGATGSLAVGLATGLLPCGLSWSAMLVASQSPPPVAILGLTLFGLATTPVLAAVGLGALRLPARWRSPVRSLVAPLLIVLGAWTILRGVPGGSGADALRPACCSEASTSAILDEVTEQVSLGEHADHLPVRDDG